MVTQGQKVKKGDPVTVSKEDRKLISKQSVEELIREQKQAKNKQAVNGIRKRK